MGESWVIVWRIPASMQGWRERMQRTPDGFYIGTNEYDTEEEATQRAKSDVEKFTRQADEGDISAPPEFVRVQKLAAFDAHASGGE